MRILFSSTPVFKSHENKPGVIIDHHADGRIVGLEILEASKRMEDPTRFENAITS